MAPNGVRTPGVTARYGVRFFHPPQHAFASGEAAGLSSQRAGIDTRTRDFVPVV